MSLQREVPLPVCDLRSGTSHVLTYFRTISHSCTDYEHNTYTSAWYANQSSNHLLRSEISGALPPLLVSRSIFAATDKLDSVQLLHLGIVPFLRAVLALGFAPGSNCEPRVEAVSLTAALAHAAALAAAAGAAVPDREGRVEDEVVLVGLRELVVQDG